jgi:hypothetical protein
MKKKYELTSESIEHAGVTLYRIKALRDFGRVKKGDLGGYVEKEANLSHEGDCWVGGIAKVYNEACVFVLILFFILFLLFISLPLYLLSRVVGSWGVIEL